MVYPIKTTLNPNDLLHILDSEDNYSLKFGKVDNFLEYLNLRSLTFTAANSQYLSRSWGAGGTSRKKYTISFFYKRSSIDAFMVMCGLSDVDANNRFLVQINDENKIDVSDRVSGTFIMRKVTSGTFTDTTSWHHFSVAIDTDQTTADNRCRIYHDGIEVTSWETNTNYALGVNSSINNNAGSNFIGKHEAGGYYNGLLDEIIYVDGLQLTPNNFASGSSPVKYSGGFGDKGFNLRFEDNSSITTLGEDSSENGNNWALNNMTTGNSSTNKP